MLSFSGLNLIMTMGRYFGYIHAVGVTFVTVKSPQSHNGVVPFAAVMLLLAVTFWSLRARFCDPHCATGNKLIRESQWHRARALSLGRQVMHDRSWSPLWTSDPSVHARLYTCPEILWSQILCRLYKWPLDETVNWGPPCAYSKRMTCTC